MSEVLVLTTGSTGTTHGTFAGATTYADVSGADWAVAFRGLASDDERKRKLIDATRYLNTLGYIDGYTDFATRDALDLGTGDGDAAFPFRAAAYRLAGLAAADADVLEVEDQGSNVRAVGAGSARVEFFNPTSAAAGTAPVLPSSVLALIGAYLATNADALNQDGGTGGTGTDTSPFDPCADYDRRWPW